MVGGGGGGGERVLDVEEWSRLKKIISTKGAG